MTLKSVEGTVAKTLLCVCFSTSREHRRYFYVNERTNASQWEFPGVEENEEAKLPLPPTSGLGDTSQPSAETTGAITGKGCGLRYLLNINTNFN